MASREALPLWRAPPLPDHLGRTTGPHHRSRTPNSSFSLVTLRRSSLLPLSLFFALVEAILVPNPIRIVRFRVPVVGVEERLRSDVALNAEPGVIEAVEDDVLNNYDVVSAQFEDYHRGAVSSSSRGSSSAHDSYVVRMSET